LHPESWKSLKTPSAAQFSSSRVPRDQGQFLSRSCLAPTTTTTAIVALPTPASLSPPSHRDHHFGRCPPSTLDLTLSSGGSSRGSGDELFYTLPTTPPSTLPETSVAAAGPYIFYGTMGERVNVVGESYRCGQRWQ
ncbi:hypothetical protein Ancab_007401, partial [Ancistrocladus abbreviatus]